MTRAFVLDEILEPAASPMPQIVVPSFQPEIR
jgi:hypothetical protein